MTTEDDGTPSMDTGLYLLSQSVPYNGTLRELDTCAFVIAANYRDRIANATLFFFVTAYRQVGDNYQRLYEPVPFAFGISGNDTFECSRHTLGTGDFQLLRGDRIGVFIQDSPCVTFSGTFACPAHVNLVDPQENCSQVIYFPNTATLQGINLPPSHSLTDGNLENFFINMDAIIGKVFIALS